MTITRAHRAVLAAVFVIASLGSSACAGDVVVDEVIALAKERALNRSVPDWPSVQRQADALALATPGEAGRTAAIRFVLASLRDHHSSYWPPSEAMGAVNRSSSNDTRQTSLPIAEADVLPNHPARLVMSSWVGGGADISGATRIVRTELNKVLAASRCGLILDLSSNRGGNMWPMMGGIAPLYDEGVLETFESEDGSRQVVNVKGGVLRMNGSIFPRVTLSPLLSHPKWIALILGSRTASSAEILALGFRGQKNIRSFGQPTAGATTANQSVRLSNGGHLALTTARILDRTGAAYVGPIKPDVMTSAPLKLASDWIAEKCN